MAGFLRGGSRPPARSGGNHQREAFNEKVSKMSPMGGEKKSPMHEGGGGETKITHHPDGSHTVSHHDGEMSEHPNAGHMAAKIHSKHSDGEVGNLHAHEMGATTHHAGMDGEVNGPMEHGSAEEGAEHLGQMMGDGAENETSSTEPDDEMPSEDASGY